MPPNRDHTTLAMLGVKLDHISEHIVKIENRLDEGNRTIGDLMRDVSLTKRDIETVCAKQDMDSKAQWKKIDWLTRSVWGLVIAQAITACFMGAKLVGIKIPF